ncbi:FUSC family protein [Cystobacter fuscus]
MLAGLFLAKAVSGHAGVELVSIFVCVFFGFYLIQISYAWMVFWFTTLLSVLYGLLGRFTPELLWLRIEETVIGAIIGAVIALILFPERTTAQIQTSARQVLDAVCEYLEEAVVKRTPETDPDRLLDSARVLDARLRDLRTAAQPLTGGLRHFTPRATHTLRTVSELVLSVRHLEMGRGLMEMNDVSRELLREAAERLANNARVLASALGQEATPRVEPASTLIQEARHRLAPEEAARRGTASPFRLLHWLTRVDDMLTQLARTEREPPRVLVPWRA